MHTIKGLQRKLLLELRKVRGFAGYTEYEGCYQGDKKQYGNHVNVGMTTIRPSREDQEQIVRLFHKLYSRRTKRLKLTQTSYPENPVVKSELIILV